MGTDRARGQGMAPHRFRVIWPTPVVSENLTPGWGSCRTSPRVNPPSSGYPGRPRNGQTSHPGRRNYPATGPPRPRAPSPRRQTTPPSRTRLRLQVSGELRGLAGHRPSPVAQRRGRSSLPTIRSMAQEPAGAPEWRAFVFRLHRTGRQWDQRADEVDWEESAVGTGAKFRAVLLGASGWYAPGPVTVTAEEDLDDPVWSVFAEGESKVPIMTGHVGGPLRQGEQYDLPVANEVVGGVRRDAGAAG
jgi:hypothetical protein